MSTEREYFPEAVQTFFEVNDKNPKHKGVHIDTREGLIDYDPEMFDLVVQLFPCQNRMVDRCSNLTKGIKVQTVVVKIVFVFFVC